MSPLNLRVPIAVKVVSLNAKNIYNNITVPKLSRSTQLFVYPSFLSILGMVTIAAIWVANRA
jgi:hypothetical protein